MKPMTRIDSPQGSWKIYDSSKNPLCFFHTPLPKYSHIGLIGMQSDMFPVHLSWPRFDLLTTPVGMTGVEFDKHQMGAPVTHDEDGA